MKKAAAEMKEVIKKILFILILFVVYQNIFYILFIPEIYTNNIYVIYLLTAYITTAADTFARPITKERNPSKKFSVLLLVTFLMGPFFLILAFFENRFLIMPYISFWDNIIISYLGFCIYLVAGLIVVTARIQLGRFGSGELIIAADHELYTEGLYRYSRNPMYLGGIIGVVGFALIFRSILTGFGLFIFYFALFKMRIKEEDKILEAEFKEKFSDYQRRTKRLIPYIY